MLNCKCHKVYTQLELPEDLSSSLYAIKSMLSSKILKDLCSVIHVRRLIQCAKHQKCTKYLYLAPNNCNSHCQTLQQLAYNNKTKQHIYIHHLRHQTEWYAYRIRNDAELI